MTVIVIVPPAAGGGSLPSGGATGNVLMKASAADGDVLWSPEIVNARGGLASVDARMTVVSRMVAANDGGYVVGEFVDAARGAAGAGSITGVAARMELIPFMVSRSIRVNPLGLEVTTGVGGALGKIVIYTSDSSGWPDALLYNSADLDMSASAFVSNADNVDLIANVRYWAGTRVSSTAVYRGIALTSLASIGRGAGAGSTYGSLIRRGVPYANPTPNPWVFTAAELVAGAIGPGVRMQIASLL